jgi:hypothetical protein
MSTFDKQMTAQREWDRFKKMNHPRIQVVDGHLIIDAWCDGDDAEAQQVANITRKWHNATK